MPTYLGKKKSGGPYFAKSEEYEKEFPECKSKTEFYALLRIGCKLHPNMSNLDVWEEVSSNWTITPDGFVKDTSA